MAENLPTVGNPVPVQPLPTLNSNPQPVYQQPVYDQPVYQQAAPQPAMQQPVYQQQPAPMMVAPAPAQTLTHSEAYQPSVLLVSHSSLFYWWPVWAVGYIMALVTQYEGVAVQLGGNTVWITPSNNPGVLFFLTLFTVIMISNVVVRGLASTVVILTMITATVTLAYFGLWDNILAFFGNLHIHLNQGAYFWFATLMCLVWTLTTFVFDRMSYWRVRPGQMTHEFVLGASSRSYDTENMSFEKRRDDVFRHWLLGLGSGDLIINAFNGGKPEELHIPNVLFVGLKVRAVEQLIAMRPGETETIKK